MAAVRSRALLESITTEDARHLNQFSWNSSSGNPTAIFSDLGEFPKKTDVSTSIFIIIIITLYIVAKGPLITAISRRLSPKRPRQNLKR